MMAACGIISVLEGWTGVPRRTSDAAASSHGKPLNGEGERCCHVEGMSAECILQNNYAVDKENISRLGILS